MAAPNAGHIIPKNEEDLYRAIENLESVADGLKAQQETLDAKIAAVPADFDSEKLRKEVADQQTEIAELREYCRTLDERMPQGSKIYMPQNGDRPDAKWRKDFGDMLGDIWAKQVLGREQYSNDLHKRTWSGQRTVNQVEGVSADGGYLVPIEYSSRVAMEMEQWGFCRRNFEQVSMTSKTFQYPNLATDVAMSWPAESVAPSVTKATFGAPTITAKKMVGTDPLSLEVLDDSSPAIRNVLIDRFMRAVPKEEDRVFIAGDISGAGDPFDGLLIVSGVQQFDMASTMISFAKLTYEDLVDLSDEVSPHSLGGAKWAFSTSIINLIRKLKDDYGRPLWAEMASSSPPSILGYPFERVEVMPVQSDTAVSTSFGLFANFRDGVAMGSRQEMRIDFSTHSEFPQANVVMRVMERVGYVVKLGALIGRITTAAS